MQKITPFLWFSDKAEEAVNHYISVFNDSKIIQVARYNEAGPGPEGTVMVIDFQLEGQRFTALNGGPAFSFTPAISLLVKCQTQAEVDRYWDQLSADKESEQCGWLKDKYGLSWQIIPTVLMELMDDPDPVKANRVMKAMLQMKKIDIPTLRRAHAGH